MTEVLDQLYAYHPVTGKLHSASPDYPWFEETMRRQGYRIERVPARATYERHTAKAQARPAVEDAVPVEEVQAVEGVPSSGEQAGLPAVGEWLEHPLLGVAQVVRMLTMPGGERVPVCVSGRGEGMVKPGEWRSAAPLGSAPEEAQPAEPLSSSLQLPPLPVPTPSGAVYYQPSLF